LCRPNLELGRNLGKDVIHETWPQGRARKSKKRARLARGCGILPQGSFQEDGRIFGDRAPAAIGLSLRRWICLMAASRRGRRSNKLEMAPGEATPSGLKC
jgi:hypothetical protein